MKQKSCQKFIFKLHSKKLRKANWDLTLPVDKALRDCPEDIVSISDSQVLRWIDEINQVGDADARAREIRRSIKLEKRKPTSRESKLIINKLYSDLYDLQYQKDYLCVIMDRESDYDRANLGFKVNGITYRRFLGTNGGIKNSTIVYVNQELYPELKKRLDNGRNKEIPLVPAKLEAYQALVCSGSTPLPPPKGFIVVDDCITHFTDDVITINDEADGEPILEYVDGYEIEHNDSDGYGLMLPEYSKRVNGELNGDFEHTIAGMNSRYSWTKGMVFTFDFIEFAEKVAGTYEIVDAWGDKRDVRDAEVILTVSMLKLWDSYDSWEDYYENCEKNHYQFSTPKVAPDELENVRNTNYQFLQSYALTDDELQELCEPTISEIRGVLGLDRRKSIAFMAGFDITEETALSTKYDYSARALMVHPDVICDPFIRKKIYNMIKTRIEAAKRGAVKINANFAMISGDPYALCQNMFGLGVTGILKAGELYHKYWIDKGAAELVCFRAPMTNFSNIRKLKLNTGEDAAHWYQYMTTVVVLNAWDTTCDALNGADKDGDTFMCTDNPVLLKNTWNERTIMCMQRKAEKKVVTEEDIIKANKLAFNDDIGKVTNNATAMFEVQAHFEPGSKEYETLAYRILTAQLFQQNTIDRAKGIISKPMPEYWYRTHPNKPEEDDDEDIRKSKEFNMQIVASKKPLFMIYVYPDLKKEYNAFIKTVDHKITLLYSNLGIRNIDDLRNYEDKTEDMKQFIQWYDKYLPVGVGDCLVNKITHLLDVAFKKTPTLKGKQPEFDPSIYKSNVPYSKVRYKAIAELYARYRADTAEYERKLAHEKISAETKVLERSRKIEYFRKEVDCVCPNEDELCDIIIDLCYNTEYSKQFAWDMCGKVMIKNLLAKTENTASFPRRVDNNGEFEYAGNQFVMETFEYNEESTFNKKRVSWE